jgi:hypothetical protein
VAFRSWRINLVKRSRSSFCSYYVYLFVCRWGSSFSLRRRRRELSVRDPDRWGLRALLGLSRCKSSEEAHSFIGQRVRDCREKWTLPHKLWLSFESSFINSNTWYLICNNFNLNFIYDIVCLYVCVHAFSLHWESSDIILRDKPLISEVVMSHLAPVTPLPLDILYDR